MNLLDIHAHLNFPQYEADREEVIKRTIDAGCGVINVGTGLQTSREVVELTKHPNFWATVGVHPHETGVPTSEEWEELERLAGHPQVVAIGECGLDFFRIEGDTSQVKAVQQAVFERQIALAQKVGKPLMLHIRDSYDEVLATLKNFPGVRAHAHFFAGSWEQAEQFLDLGLTISFTGVITFVRDYDEIVKNTPLDRLLAETDAPYVTPAPFRGRRNEPLYVAEVVRKLAELKGVGVTDMQAQLLSTAERVFGLKNIA